MVIEHPNSRIALNYILETYKGVIKQKTDLKIFTKCNFKSQRDKNNKKELRYKKE